MSPFPRRHRASSRATRGDRSAFGAQGVATVLGHRVCRTASACSPWDCYSQSWRQPRRSGQRRQVNRSVGLALHQPGRRRMSTNMAAGGAVCGNGSPPPLFSSRVLSRARGHQRSALIAASERPQHRRSLPNRFAHERPRKRRCWGGRPLSGRVTFGSRPECEECRIARKTPS